MMKHIIPVIILLLAALAHAQPTQPTTQAATTQPVFLFHPPNGTVIENVVINAKNFPPAQRGIGVGVNGSLNCTIRNCKIVGFRFGIMGQGGNPGIKVYNNEVADATSGGTEDAQGIYIEGAANGWSIHDNYIHNCGWWAGYDVNDPIQRTLANRHHGGYLNEFGGATGDGDFYNNIVIDSAGSNVISRKGGRFSGNVFRPGGDFDLIVSELAASAAVNGNAHFGPRLDAVPYYGGGIKLLSPVFNCTGNLFAGSAAITFNPTAIDKMNAVIPGQLGLWPKPGASRVVAPGTPVPTLEAFYGVSTQADLYNVIRPGDAKKITNWMNAWVSEPTPTPPAPTPIVLGTGTTTDGKPFIVIQK